MKRELLNIEGGKIKKGNNVIFDDLSLELFQGEITGIVFDDILEQKLFIDMLLGDVLLYSGKIFVNEERKAYEEAARLLKQQVAVIGSKSKLLPSITIEDNIFLFSDRKLFLDQKEYRERFQKLRTELNISDDMPHKVRQDITEHVKLDNMRKEFVADVSHELKTPITSIMGYADTLLEGEYDKETQNKFLSVIAAEARRMAKLVTDLLTLSRYDSKKMRVDKTEFDLGDLVKKCQEKLKFEIEKKNHNMECFVTASVPPVEADKDGIERVVLNILSNAIKYTKENGTIKVYVGFVYNDAYIKVIDNGIGIPEEDLKRIFERFYRVDKARTREMGGTGLGLSIAKEILNQNKGSIDIKSEVGKGTEVVIRLPAKK